MVLLLLSDLDTSQKGNPEGCFPLIGDIFRLDSIKVVTKLKELYWPKHMKGFQSAQPLDIWIHRIPPGVFI